MLLGILNLSEYIFGYNLGIDDLLWKEEPGTIATTFPGRMSISTALNFTLLGFIFLMLGKRKYHWPIQILLIAMIPGSMLVTFNYLFGVSFLNSIPKVINTALHTAILFIVLCLGVFFSSALDYLRFSFMKKIAGFFVLIFLVRSIIFFAINKNNELAADTDRRDEHTREVLLMAEKVNTQSNEIQNEARGYIITGEENFRLLFINTADTIANIIGRLSTITKDNAGQQLRIDTLEKHVNTYIAFQKELVNIRRIEGFEAARKIILNDKGKLLLNGVHSIVTAIEQEENQILAKRKKENEQSIQNSSGIFDLFQVIFALLLLAALKMIYDNVQLRNKVEDALQKSLKDISDYKYALDESSIVAITDQKGIIKQVNDNFCKISKYKREELIGQDHRIINTGYHPKEFIRDLWVTIANGKIWKGELKNKAKDGTYYWVDTTIVPFLNELGKPYQYVAIRSDTTQRKELEDEIKQFNLELEKRVEEKTKEVIEKEQQYRFLLQNMREGIQVIGYDWRYLFVNNSVVEQSKYSNEELLGHPMLEKYPGIENAELFKVLQRCMEERSADIFENEFTFSDGTKGWFELSIQPVSEGLFILSMDITERKKAEEKLKKYAAELKSSNTELERFAYVASHDLQEPLRMVSSFLQLLERKYNGQLDETARKYIHFSVDGAYRMKQLINDLLQYSRIGTAALEIVPVDMNEVLAEVLMLFKNEVHTIEAEIIVENLPVIYAGKSAMSQLMQNLVGNAFKYRSKEKPVVTITGKEENDEWIFTVKDNGIGIDSKYKDKIFVIFQRLHNKDEFNGTGIGLAICKKIIERYHGKIWVESEFGKGSKFIFAIPKKHN